MTTTITIDLRKAFLGTFALVAEAGYRNCDADAYDDKDDFDSDVANAISETLAALGIDEPEDGTRADFLGQFYDILDDAGVAQWTRDQDEDEDDVAAPSQED